MDPTAWAPQFYRDLELLTQEKLIPAGGKFSISPCGMIAGNPKWCRTLVACAVILMSLIVVSTAFVAMRKRTAPIKAVPMHPSTFIAR
jgi:hypothetical protein